MRHDTAVGTAERVQVSMQEWNQCCSSLVNIGEHCRATQSLPCPPLVTSSRRHALVSRAHICAADWHGPLVLQPNAAPRQAEGDGRTWTPVAIYGRRDRGAYGVDVPALGRIAVERRGEQDALVLVAVVLPAGVGAVRSAELNPDAWCREQSPQTPIGNSGQTGHAGRLTLGVLEALVAALLEGLL